MVLKIHKMSITAFKGIHSLELLFDGKDAAIKGRNGLGKTSIYDAFLWCLFGKDSNGATAFEVKPLDANGNPVIGVDTEVVCELLIDDKLTTFSRSLHEKYKKLGGVPAYQGDETVCYVDSVPVKLTEYKSKVAELIGDEETFRMLAIHGAFMNLPWEKRRKYLVDATGGDADAEILNDPQFSEIPEILNGKTPEEAKKRLRDELKRLNDDLNGIPKRLDELHRQMDGVSEEQKVSAENEIARLNSEIEKVQSVLNGGEEAYRKARELSLKESEIISQMDAMKRNSIAGYNEMIDKIQRAIRREDDDITFKNMSMTNTISELNKEEAYLAEAKKEREALIAAWHEWNDKAFEQPEVETVCPYCGQELTEEKIQDAVNKLREGFDKNRTEQMDGITRNGKRAAQIINDIQMKLGILKEKLEKEQSERDEAKAKKAKLESDLETAKNSPAEDVTLSFEYIALQSKLDIIRSHITDSGNDNRSELMSKVRELQSEVAKQQMVITQYKVCQGMIARVDELEIERKRLGADIMRLTGQLELLASYNTARCTALETEINSMFDTIVWKLFDYLKDGGVKDTCTATVNGVPYDGGLNNAARINAGIEAIRVLSKSVGVSVPCFVDNAEAVNSVDFTGGQMIRLVVSTDSELTFVKED